MEADQAIHDPFSGQLDVIYSCLAICVYSVSHSAKDESLFGIDAGDDRQREVQ